MFPPMLMRLGNVLYWTGCLLGGLLALFAVALMVFTPQGVNNLVYSILIAGIGLAVFFAGRALRYILGGT